MRLTIEAEVNAVRRLMRARAAAELDVKLTQAAAVLPNSLERDLQCFGHVPRQDTPNGVGSCPGGRT